MKWLLDTNVCIDALRGRADVIARLKACAPEELGISVITGFELIQGAERAPARYQEGERRKVHAFLAKMRQIPFRADYAERAAEINAALLNAGTPVSVTDVFIAATALELSLPVVTSNRRDFDRIEGLAVVDWREGN